MWWLAVVCPLAAVTALTVFAGEGTWERPELLFSLVTIVAAICVLSATVVIALADQAEMAEVGLLGAALMATSVMPLVHGLVTPGVLYDDNAAFHTSVALTMPVAAVVATPLLFRNTAFGRWGARHWRAWTLITMVGVFVLASIVVLLPDAIQLPDPHDPLTIAHTVVAAQPATLVLHPATIGIGMVIGNPGTLLRGGFRKAFVEISAVPIVSNAGHADPVGTAAVCHQ